jgi:hypothetical protein
MGDTIGGLIDVIGGCSPPLELQPVNTNAIMTHKE